MQNALSQIREKISEIEEESADGNYIYRGEPKYYPKVSSPLYREYEVDIEMEHLDIEVAQAQMVEEAKDYIIHDTDKAFEILIQVQHHGGKTNLIDFTTDYLIALFFACDGFFDEPGRVILLGERAQRANRVLRPRHAINRVIGHKSVSAQPPKGFIDPEHYQKIEVSTSLKQSMLDYLEKYHGISTKTIYNDLHGFISNKGIHGRAYTQFYRGLTYHHNRKQYDKAIEHYSDALKLNPQLAAAYYNRGVAYNENGDYESAIADFTKAIQLKVDDAVAYTNRSIAYENTGEHARAIEDQNTATQLEPNLAQPDNNRTFTDDEQEDVDPVLEAYNTAIQPSPNDAEADTNPDGLQ